MKKNLVENSQQFLLETLWKQKEPIALWDKLPEEIIMNIFRLVDRRFKAQPSVEKIGYKRLENIINENKIEESKIIDNSQQYTLDILWKQREPVELWEKLPEEIMLIIFRFVDSKFTPISYRNVSLNELLLERSQNIQVNTDKMRESEKVDTRMPYENFMEMFDMVMQYRNKN